MPAGPTFKLEIFGEVQFNRAFSRVSSDIKDFRPIWPKVSDEFYKIETALFASKGATGKSGAWPALTPAYAKLKAKQFPAGFAAGPMHRTFALRDSLTKTGVGGAVYRGAPDSLIIGSDLPYGIYHMQPSGKRPARRPVDFTDGNQRSIQRVIQRELLKYIQRDGFDVAGYQQQLGFASI
jgi:hypothetical protein